MELAVNYSAAAAELLRRGAIRFDRFKTPAWPDLAATARRLMPTYVHFPLLAGSGRGEVLDFEAGRPADWNKVTGLLVETGTPMVNVHLAPRRIDCPDIPFDSLAPEHADLLVVRMARDLGAVVARFGGTNVVAENDLDCGETVRAAYLPEVIAGTIREAGCGLLLDLTHARITAGSLGMDPWEYLSGLPLDRLCEMHVTGAQRIDRAWAERLRAAGIGDGIIARSLDRMVDHLPMTEEDWELFERAIGAIRDGQWATPWVITFEYGGVGAWWEAVTDADALRGDVARLYALVHDMSEPMN